MSGVGMLERVAPFDDPDDYDAGGELISREDRALMREWERDRNGRQTLDGVPVKRAKGRRG